MKLTLANKRIIAIIAVLVILASVLCAVLIPASSVACATNWGGKDTANLSYYKDGFWMCKAQKPSWIPGILAV